MCIKIYKLSAHLLYTDWLKWRILVIFKKASLLEILWLVSLKIVFYVCLFGFYAAFNNISVIIILQRSVITTPFLGMLDHLCSSPVPGTKQVTDKVDSQGDNFGQSQALQCKFPNVLDRNHPPAGIQSYRDSIY